MTILDWPTTERPREKLLNRGVEALSEAELIAVIIQNGTRGKNAVVLAREWLSHYGSLSALLHAEPNDQPRPAGLGPATWCQIKAAAELYRRSLQESLMQHETINDADSARQFLIAQLGHLKQEVFAVLFLNNQHQVIKFEKLFFGTVNQSAVYPAEVMKRALALHASAIIMVHNHPSGNLLPSIADKQITYRLRECLDLVDISLLDHIIVGGKHSFSFTESGLLLR